MSRGITRELLTQQEKNMLGAVIVKAIRDGHYGNPERRAAHRAAELADERTRRAKRRLLARESRLDRDLEKIRHAADREIAQSRRRAEGIRREKVAVVLARVERARKAVEFREAEAAEIIEQWECYKEARQWVLDVRKDDAHKLRLIQELWELPWPKFVRKARRLEKAEGRAAEVPMDEMGDDEG